MNDAIANDDARYGCPTCLSVFRLGFSRCPIDGGVLQQLADDPLVGSTLADRYVIERCIGEGGMGRVYCARHVRMTRKFAIKVLFGDFATDPKMRDRFAREAEAASRLSHPNVISVMDFGETEHGLLYLAMDFVNGRELQTAIHDDGPFPRERFLEISKQLCHGLAHAHAEGLIHRDFKTENVILAEREGSETAKIVDFGIAVMFDNPEQRLTTQGVVVGTPACMSPEQATGQPLDARSDLFSLGVVMYQMLSGVMPFEGDAMAIAQQNLAVDPPAVSTRVPGLEVSQRLETIVRKLIEKLPDDRYQSAEEVLKALEQAKAATSPTATSPTPLNTMELAAAGQKPKPWLWLVAVAVLLVGGVFAITLSRDTPRPKTTGYVELTAAASGQDANVASAPHPTDSSLMADASGVTSKDAAATLTRVDKPSDKTEKTRKRRTKPIKKSAKKSRHPAQKTTDKPKPEVSAPQKISSADITQLYVSVGEALKSIEKHHPRLSAPLRKAYSSIPFNDALRVPSLRKDVDKKLRRLRKKLRQLR